MNDSSSESSGLHSAERDSALEMRGLPRIAFLDNSHDRKPGAPRVLAVRRGELGCYPIWSRHSAAELNRLFRVSSPQSLAMYFGSLLGWDVPGADPNHPLVLALAAHCDAQQAGAQEA